jgi:hypothetical protein
MAPDRGKPIKANSARGIEKTLICHPRNRLTCRHANIDGASTTSRGMKLAMSLRAKLRRRPPSFTPRNFAAASASRARSRVMRNSSSAIMAMMLTVRRFASGMLTTTKSTPAFWRPSKECGSRDRRSSRAMISVALWTRQARRASSSYSRSRSCASGRRRYRLDGGRRLRRGGDGAEARTGDQGRRESVASKSHPLPGRLLG